VAQNRANDLTPLKKMEYIYDNSEFYYDLYLNNLEENICGIPVFVSYPKGIEHPSLFSYMENVNLKYYNFHLFFLYVIPFLLVLLIFKKEFLKLIIAIILIGLSAYYILVTGISFWQGDRLVLPSISIWSCLYVFILFEFTRLFIGLKLFLINWKSKISEEFTLFRTKQ